MGKPRLLTAEHRYVSSSHCRGCIKRYKAQYQIKNADRIRRKMRGYYRRNYERIKQYQKRHYIENEASIRKRVALWARKNADYVKQYHRDYYRANRERFRDCLRLRRADPAFVRKSAERVKQWVKMNPHLRKEISSRYAWRKRYGRDAGEKLFALHKLNKSLEKEMKK